MVTEDLLITSASSSAACNFPNWSLSPTTDSKASVRGSGCNKDIDKG